MYPRQTRDLCSLPTAALMLDLLALASIDVSDPLRVSRAGSCGSIAEAVQRPTMKFVATKTVDQVDLQALHRVRERLVSQRTGIISQIRAFLLERGIAVQGRASCGPSCQASWRSAPTCSRLACCASSRTFPETGAGWMSASRTS